MKNLIVDDGSHGQLVTKINDFRSYLPVLYTSVFALIIGGMMVYCVASARWHMLAVPLTCFGVSCWLYWGIMLSPNKFAIEQIRSRIEKLVAQDPSLEDTLNQVDCNLDTASVWWVDHVNVVLHQYDPNAASDTCEVSKVKPKPQRKNQNITRIYF